MTPRRAPPAPNPALAYFLDIDGTLVGFASSPSGIRIDTGLRRVIEMVHASSGGALALITGRPIAEVDRLFPGIDLPVAGQHGVERRAASGRVAHHPFPSRRLNEARTALQEAATAHPGLFLEDKGLSLALHYRQAPRLGGYAHRLARRAAGRLGRTFGVQSGKRVVEIRPAGRDKGSAIRAYMRERPFRGRTPVFLGDDLTDEHGFAAVNRLGGYSIKVGAGPTAARWRLPDVAAVRGWLRHGRPIPRAIR